MTASLPMSNAIYFAMQRTLGSLKSGAINPLESYKAAVSMMEWARASGLEGEGKSFLEVGTGRTINLPTALWLCGAERVVTVDPNPYLSETLVRESNRRVWEQADEVRALFGARAQTPQFAERFERLTKFSGGLAGLLKMMNVEYISPGDAARLPLPSHGFEFHISHAVFEHIPGDTLRGILEEARRVLVPGGLLIHIIDPSDHFSHDDTTITAVNFLQFDADEWGRLAGNQFTYHNRLRAYEFIELFRRAGVEVLWHKQTVDDASLRALRNGFRLSPEFRDVRLEELAVTSLNLVGRFREG